MRPFVHSSSRAIPVLSYLIRQSRHLLIAAGAASIISGLCSVLLVMQISAALTTTDPVERAALAWRFAAIAVTTMLAQIVSSVLFQRLCQRAHAELRRFISARVISNACSRRPDLRQVKFSSPNLGSNKNQREVTIVKYGVREMVSPS